MASAEQTARLRSLIAASKSFSGTHNGRFLDYGIELRICRQDIEGGREFVPGLPPLKAIRAVRIGGMLDTLTRKIIAPTQNPVTWYLGERQASIILALYERDTTHGTRTLLYSAEGGGKTVLMAQGLIAYVLGLITIGQIGAIGATAPTHQRVLTFVKAVGQRIPIDTTNEPFPEAWGRYNIGESELRLASGHTVQFRTTKKHSESTGSPVQGFTWLGSFDDELQDTAENGADPDIEARMRGARFSFRLTTATAKDSPTWRTFRDEKSTSPDWRIERIRYDENPFVWPEHWERMQRNMSLREWQRRGLALDVGPERMVYTTWSRQENIRPVPVIGAQDVTAEVLSKWGHNLKMLVGHDPGRLCNTSTCFKAFRLAGQRNINWWIVDEVVTHKTTAEEHAKVLQERLRTRWGLNRIDAKGRPIEGGDEAFIRSDPYSDSGNDTSRPDKSVYTTFRSSGFKISPANSKSVADRGGLKTVSMPIPKEAGIQMVVGLLCNSMGERRLFVDCDDRRTPCAPRAVESFELSERDASGLAEKQDKDENDLSHFTATVRYALWMLERPRMAS